MRSYYMLECLSPPGLFHAAVDYRDDDPRRSWISGQRFDRPPPTPLRARLRMREKTALAEMWKVPLPLMSLRLLEALRSAGVDNLDTYPAVLVDGATGVEYREHVAFNLVGSIAAADLSRSAYSALDGPLISVDFTSLALDESRIKGTLMFRLAESVNGIVVHERVRQAVLARGIDTLTFLDPEQWAG